MRSKSLFTFYTRSIKLIEKMKISASARADVRFTIDDIDDGVFFSERNTVWATIITKKLTHTHKPILFAYSIDTTKWAGPSEAISVCACTCVWVCVSERKINNVCSYFLVCLSPVHQHMRFWRRRRQSRHLIGWSCFVINLYTNIVCALAIAEHFQHWEWEREWVWDCLI